MANLKTISIFGKQGKFGVKYSYTKDGKTFYRISFKKTASNIPSMTGYLKVTFDSTLVGNPKIGQTKTTNDGRTFKENDTIYLDGKLTWEIDNEKEAEYKARQQSAVDSLFE